MKKLLVRQFSLFCFFIPHTSKYSPQHVVPKHTQLMLFLEIKETIFHVHKNALFHSELNDRKFFRINQLLIFRELIFDLLKSLRNIWTLSKFLKFYCPYLYIPIISTYLLTTNHGQRNVVVIICVHFHNIVLIGA
jgi:hypothetical protein